MTRNFGIIPLGILLGLASAGNIQAAATTFYYNNTANPGWSGPTSWGASSSGPFESDWEDGNAAFIATGSGKTINLTQNVTVESLLRASTSTHTLQKTSSPSSPVTMTMGGGTIDAGSSSGGDTLGTFAISDGVTLTGDFTLTRGNLGLQGATGTFASHSGSITVTGGVLNINSAGRLSAASNLNLNGGDTFLKVGSTIGDVSMAGGTLNVGTAGGPGLNFELKSLAGTSGTLRANINPGASTTPVHQLTISQEGNTAYSGSIVGYAQSSGGTGGAHLQLTKSGAGDLALAGTIEDLQTTTTVDGGRLYINAATSSFGDKDGSEAISVTGGAALGGTGTITTLAGDNVVIGVDGKLVAGTFGQADRTSYALGSGSVLDISAASAQTEWLRFDLGSKATPGTTYSQILLTGGGLTIGDSFEFDDFDFNPLAGFGAGKYTLFSVTDGDIIGSLGAADFGEINGMNASLSLDSNGIYLTVVPEPGATLLGLIGGSALFLWSRRRPSNKRPV